MLARVRCWVGVGIGAIGFGVMIVGLCVVWLADIVGAFHIEYPEEDSGW